MATSHPCLYIIQPASPFVNWRKDDERYIRLILTKQGSNAVACFEKQLLLQFDPIFEEVGQDPIQDMVTGLHALQKIIAHINRKED